MGMRYAVPKGARLKVLTVSARVQVVAEDRSDVEIDPPERRIENSEDGHVMETHSKSTNLQIRVPTDVYEWVRSDPRRFLIAPGHETPEVEDVVRVENAFSVVEKQGEAARYVEHLDPRSRE